MRADIGEAYRRVMSKAWTPFRELNGERERVRPLTEHTAKMYIKAVIREWRKLGYQLPDANRYIEGVEFVQPYKSIWGGKRRSFRDTIVLGNWHDMNHEFSHWLFWKYSRATRRSGNGQHHHCDRHLEWERTGAEWICRRMIEAKPFKLEE